MFFSRALIVTLTHLHQRRFYTVFYLSSFLQCSQCKQGYFEDDCSSTCNSGNCAGLPVCNQTTGDQRRCFSCKSGWYGTSASLFDLANDCEVPCEQGNCAGVVSCQKDDGAGRQCNACTPGFWGDACTETCHPGNCATDAAVTCDQSTGQFHTFLHMYSSSPLQTETGTFMFSPFAHACTCA